MNPRKIVALPSSGSDYMRVITNLRMLGIALIDLRGLNTLRILSDFKFTLEATKSKALLKLLNLILPGNDNKEIYEIPTIP